MGKATAKVYFSRGSEQLAKDLAVRIRNEGNNCHLICANHFRDDRDIEEEAHAVAIQATNGKAAMIGRTYKEFNSEVEVHYFDDEGEFVDGPANPEPKPQDPFANLKKEDAEKKDAGKPADDEKPDPKPSKKRAKKRAKPAESDSKDDKG